MHLKHFNMQKHLCVLATKDPSLCVCRFLFNLHKHDSRVMGDLMGCCFLNWP